MSSTLNIRKVTHYSLQKTISSEFKIKIVLFKSIYQATNLRVVKKIAKGLLCLWNIKNYKKWKQYIKKFISKFSANFSINYTIAPECPHMIV